MHGWFVCPTVSMVTISHATGLEKTIVVKISSREHVSCDFLIDSNFQGKYLYYFRIVIELHLHPWVEI